MHGGFRGVLHSYYVRDGLKKKRKRKKQHSHIYGIAISSNTDPLFTIIPLAAITNGAKT
jgi:hypothetical protein